MIIKGGDKVLLKNGRIVEVADIKPNHIMVASDEWYLLSDVVEIIETQKKKKSWWTWWKRK